jgi:hypothetical protein
MISVPRLDPASRAPEQPDGGDGRARRILINHANLEPFILVDGCVLRLLFIIRIKYEAGKGFSAEINYVSLRALA